MTGPSRHPQASDPAASPPAPLTSDGTFVVVNLDNGEAAEASDLKHPSPKYGSLGDDVELGHNKPSEPTPKHVSNSSKDDAADGETVCRVCHLGLTSGNSESIVLGCACKQDLALCHRDCAEEWFKIRGNTVCEICGETAKNVRISPLETASVSTRGAAVLRVEEEETGGVQGVQGNGAQQQMTTMSRLRYLWTNQLIRNSLLATMIVVFMVPWFFRIAYF